MEHVGIDLGSRNSHICVRNAEAEVVMETRVPTAELVSWLSGRERAQVVFETCCETFTVAEAVRCHGHDVRVVPSSVVRQLGVGYRGVKNDVRDARVLSRASVSLGEELPTVHIPSAESRRRQRLLTQRAALVRSRTILINGVKSQLRAELMKVGTGTARCAPDPRPAGNPPRGRSGGYGPGRGRWTPRRWPTASQHHPAPSWGRCWPSPAARA